MLVQAEVGRTKNRHKGKKKRKDEKADTAVASDALRTSTRDGSSTNLLEGKKREKLLRKKKDKTEDVIVDVPNEPKHEVMLDQEEPVRVHEKISEKKKTKRKRDKGDTVKLEDANSIETSSDKPVDSKKIHKSSGKKKRKAHSQSETQAEVENKMLDNGVHVSNAKPTKVKRKDKKVHKLPNEGAKLLEKEFVPNEEDVYHISSGDEDSSRGMKKWVTEYYQSRPGLNVLQERIDVFITAHEAQLEQERKEREALAAEGGWTVVTHQKGRKKTTDADSGTVVGSVSQAALEFKVAKKKNKEVGLDFYRFQKREAKRNELMMLQSKFEQDKKRIQELRAARKFRPY